MNAETEAEAITEPPEMSHEMTMICTKKGEKKVSEIAKGYMVERNGVMELKTTQNAGLE